MGEADSIQLLLPNVVRQCITEPSRGFNSVRPHSLVDLNDLTVQQGLIIKDLLFVFLGLEGFYIQYSEKYDENLIDSKIKGPDYKIAKHLDISLKSITKKLVRYGRYYAALRSFVEIYDTHHSGKVLQRLCHEISNFLIKYERLVVEIESQFETNPNFNISYLENNILNRNSISIEIGLLYDIITVIHEESVIRYEKSKQAAVNDDIYFQTFIANIQNDLRETGSINLTTDQKNFELCKGGLILQQIQKLSSERYLGDSVKCNISNRLFDAISADYVDMLNGWLINGEINDPYDEFLIKKNRIKESNVGISPYSEKYWEEVYVTRVDGVIEQFQSRNLQLKLLATGKFLNIYKTCTGVNDTTFSGGEVIGIISLLSRDLELKIHEFYLRANRLLMKLYFEGYKLTNLIDNLQSAYLLTDSFNIDSFLDKSFSELRRNRHSSTMSRVKHLYDDTHKIRTRHENSDTDAEDDDFQLLLDFKMTLDYSNFYENAIEILDVKSFDAMSALDSSSKFKELLNKSLEKSIPASAGSQETSNGGFDPDRSDDYAISGLTLQTNIDFPLNLMVGESYIFQYQLIFRLLIITKFINKLIDNTWKEINYSTVWKYKYFQPKVKKWVLRSRILLTRMSDFMTELQFYLNEEIIDKNYKDLKSELERSEESLKHHQQQSSSKTDSYLAETRFNTLNNNSIFDKNIMQRQQQRAISTSTTGSTILNGGGAINDSIGQQESPDIEYLKGRIGTFLSNVLRYSLITNKELIDVLKRMYDLIILYNHYLSRLKKNIILLDEELFLSFKNDYPDRFEGRSIDASSINERLGKANANLGYYFTSFNDNMEDMMSVLKKFGESENRSLLILFERLENAFPAD